MTFVGGPKTHITNPRWWTAAILDKLKNRNISPMVRPIAKKFGMMMQFDSLDCCNCSYFQYLKIQDGGRRHLEKVKNHNISATV